MFFTKNIMFLSELDQSIIKNFIKHFNYTITKCDSSVKLENENERSWSETPRILKSPDD